MHFRQTRENYYSYATEDRNGGDGGGPCISAPGYHSSVRIRASPAKREGKKKRRVRGKTGKTEGKEIFIRSRSYANLDRSTPRTRAASAVPREYINFVSSRNCTPVRFKSHLPSRLSCSAASRPERDKNE